MMATALDKDSKGLRRRLAAAKAEISEQKTLICQLKKKLDEL